MRYVVAGSRALALAVTGVVVGVASVAVHPLTPGLVLGLAAPAAAVWALPLGWSSRVPFAAGWSVVVLAAAQPRGSGSYLIGSNLRGYVLLAAAFALLLVAVVTTLRRPSEPVAESKSVDPVS